MDKCDAVHCISTIKCKTIMKIYIFKYFDHSFKNK